MKSGAFDSYPAWDAPIRLFHWINFLSVIGLIALGTAILYAKELGATNDGKTLLKSIHVWFGYVFAVNLVFRLAWAFVGSRRARWRSILPFGPGYRQALASYLSGLGNKNGPRYLGHNPVGRLMVSLLFLLLISQAISGLVLAGTDIFYPPFGSWIAGWVAAPGVDPATLLPYDKTGIDAAAYDDMRAFRSPFLSVHYWVFHGLLAAIAGHIAGVVLTELREGGSIISAMFTGRKLLDRAPVDLD